VTFTTDYLQKTLTTADIIFNNEAGAIAFGRWILGIMTFLQGYDKIFNIKLRNVVEIYEQPGPDRYIFPRFWIWAGTIFTSYTELVCGALIIPGLFVDYAMSLLALNMLVVVIAFSVKNPMWDMKYVFPRLVFILILLAVPDSWDKYSLDMVLFKF
jgi:putative oxidoreductase